MEARPSQCTPVTEERPIYVASRCGINSRLSAASWVAHVDPKSWRKEIHHPQYPIPGSTNSAKNKTPWHLFDHLDVSCLLLVLLLACWLGALALENGFTVFVELITRQLLVPLPNAAKGKLTLRVVMTTLEGWIPIGTVAALDFSTCTRSTWMTHFFLYTCGG
jgi:hypothetical protein